MWPAAASTGTTTGGASSRTARSSTGCSSSAGRSPKSGRGPSRDRVLAAAIRLTDLGFFRSGGDEYAADNGSFGLATLRREHVTCHKDEITFDYVGKSRKRHVQVIAGLFATEPDGELVSAWQRLGG